MLENLKVHTRVVSLEMQRPVDGLNCSEISGLGLLNGLPSAYQ